MSMREEKRVLSKKTKKAEEFRKNLDKVSTKPLVSFSLFQVKSAPCFKKTNSELCCFKRRKRCRTYPQ